MSEFGYLSEKMAAQKIEEQVERAARTRLAGRPRRTTRRKLARGLHQLADLLDS